MATKEIELARAEIGEGCLGKAADDEPLFILRAQDVLAPSLVDAWASLVHDLADAPHSDGRMPKIVEAKKLAIAMRIWGQENGSKLPD